MPANRSKIKKLEAPLIGISRHRLATDGEGVTTLVAFHGCNLRCKYCINPACFDKPDKFPKYTPESLLKELKKDDLYFRATGGGITFGGGEPGLHAQFIAEFKKICPPEWKIRLETALQFDPANLKLLAPIVDEWIVDLKTSDFSDYEKYTGGKFDRASENINILTEELHVPKDKFLLRLPVIPDFTTTEQAEDSMQIWTEDGFTRFDIFEYQTEPTTQKQGLGKQKCETLKVLRKDLAEKNGIPYQPRECTHKGDCPGSCPLCDQELATLTAQLLSNPDSNLNLSASTIELINNPLGGDQDMGEELGDVPPFTLKGKPAQPDVLLGLMAPPTDDFVIAEPEHLRKKVLFKECAIAGISFHLAADDEIWDELDEGCEVALVRQRSNKYDSNAVAIALPDDYDGNPANFDFDFILGYLPRTENKEIAKMLDMGWADLLYAELSTVRRHGPLNDRLRISIYLLEKEKTPAPLRALYLPEDEMKASLQELFSIGLIHFRWRGLPSEDYNLPEVGQEIVLLTNMGSDILMVLTKVIATGDSCVQFIDQDEVWRKDDCICFLLSNLCGPFSIDPEKISFLSEDLESLSVYNPLPMETSQLLKSLFTNIGKIEYLDF